MQKIEINWPFGTDQNGFHYNFEFYNYLRGLETQKKKRARASSPFVLARDMPSDAIHHIINRHVMRSRKVSTIVNYGLVPRFYIIIRCHAGI